MSSQSERRLQIFGTQNWWDWIERKIHTGEKQFVSVIKLKEHGIVYLNNFKYVLSLLSLLLYNQG